jgi:hypothetical protein
MTNLMGFALRLLYLVIWGIRYLGNPHYTKCLYILVKISLPSLVFYVNYWGLLCIVSDQYNFQPDYCSKAVLTEF